MTQSEIQIQLSASLAEREALIDAILAGRTLRIEDTSAPDWDTLALATLMAVLIGVLFGAHAAGWF